MGRLAERLTLLSIHQDDGAETLGIRTPQGIVDVRSAASHFSLSAPQSLESMLREGRGPELEALMHRALAAGDASLFRHEASIRHGRLFTRPEKIVCVGLNYRRHAAEVGAQPPRVPPLFSKFANALAPHGGTVVLPPPEIATQFDYETELVAVIGRPARNVSEHDALAHVAGYCVGHDFSARDLQMELPSGQWLVGKSLDGFAPVGPYFVSADLVGDPDRLAISTRVNGELRQSSNTSDFIFPMAQLVAYISRYWTLMPGDLIFTGTPEGVILGYPEEQRHWLKAGDEIVSSIEKLGDLRFRLC
ncbi:MAG: fumarylacetoacetate hydrolase family protein [Betaproteobacteria bacterium]|nr:fumarylacetoacetate hydrolase family protein [Betaproteobacteria bacterium]